MSGLPIGLSVTLYPEAATWDSLREFVRLADEAGVPGSSRLRTTSDINGDFESIVLGPEDAAGDD